jgi:flavodoxin
VSLSLYSILFPEEIMKTLIVYFSLDGNTALVAAGIGRALGADLLELKLAEEKKRKGLAKYVWGGRQVFSRVKPALKPFTVKPLDYDLLIVGGPVWAGSPAPALLTFLSEADIKGKKAAVFCCHRGGKGEALSKLKALLAGNTIVGEIDFRNPLKSGAETWASKAADWAKRLASA